MDSVEGFDNGAGPWGVQLSRREASSSCRTPYRIDVAAFPGYSRYRSIRAAIGQGSGCRTRCANVCTGGPIVGALCPRFEGFLGTNIVDRGRGGTYPEATGPRLGRGVLYGGGVGEGGNGSLGSRACGRPVASPDARRNSQAGSC